MTCDFAIRNPKSAMESSLLKGAGECATMNHENRASQRLRGTPEGLRCAEPAGLRHRRGRRRRHVQRKRVPGLRLAAGRNDRRRRGPVPVVRSASQRSRDVAHCFGPLTLFPEGRQFLSFPHRRHSRPGRQVRPPDRRGAGRPRGRPARLHAPRQGGAGRAH